MIPIASQIAPYKRASRCRFAQRTFRTCRRRSSGSCSRGPSPRSPTSRAVGTGAVWTYGQLPARSATRHSPPKRPVQSQPGRRRSGARRRSSRGGVPPSEPRWEDRLLHVIARCPAIIHDAAALHFRAICRRTCLCSVRAGPGGVSGVKSRRCAAGHFDAQGISSRHPRTATLRRRSLSAPEVVWRPNQTVLQRSGHDGT
jgi:hypothetical protein